jgi:hypothetical protein
MVQKDKSKEELLEEIEIIQKRVAEFESADVDRKQLGIAMKDSPEKLKILTKINQAILMIKDRNKLLTEICETLVKYAYKMVWIGFCDEAAKIVVPKSV